MRNRRIFRIEFYDGSFTYASAIGIDAVEEMLQRAKIEFKQITFFGGLK